MDSVCPNRIIILSCIPSPIHHDDLPTNNIPSIVTACETVSLSPHNKCRGGHLVEMTAILRNGLPGRPANNMHAPRAVTDDSHTSRGLKLQFLYRISTTTTAEGRRSFDLSKVMNSHTRDNFGGATGGAAPCIED